MECFIKTCPCTLLKRDETEEDKQKRGRSLLVISQCKYFPVPQQLRQDMASQKRNLLGTGGEKYGEGREVHLQEDFKLYQESESF
jgi:hypothetical protein